MAGNNLLAAKILRDSNTTKGGTNALAEQFPELYGAIKGLLGTAPDEVGGSVLDGSHQAQKAGAGYGFPLGLLAQMLPLAKVTKGMPVGMSIKAVDDAKFVYPQEQALLTAQRNAALPVEQGGLGLHPNNTPMERAQAMGYENAFHGTASDVKQIDQRQLGSATGANSAKMAFWAASDPTTAAGYADYAANSAPVRQLINQANTYERLAHKGGNSQTWWDKYDDALRQADDLEQAVRDNPLRGQNIMPLSINTGKSTVADAAGAEFTDMEGGVNNLLRQAKRKKNDVAILQNLSDDVGRNGRPTTHYGVLNPSAVRSQFAAFDPFRRNEPDLLAGALPFSALADEENRNQLRGLLGY